MMCHSGASVAGGGRLCFTVSHWNRRRPDPSRLGNGSDDTSRLRVATAPPHGSRIRKDLQKEGKGVASRFFQLLSGHAAIGPYLAERIKTFQSNKCWWCGSGERQSRHHLFVKCRSRSRSCGGASGRPASGRTRERQPSDCYSRTRERPRGS